jgi:RHS repeat-associated protein
MTFSVWGLTGYEVQYWTGTAWATVPGGAVTGNDKVWRKFTFPALTTEKIRILTNAGLAQSSRLTEVEAYQAAETATNDGVQWFVSDHLGTPRIIADLSGSLSDIRRHDYLPFGEELFDGTGGRTTGQGYGQPNTLRERWATYERDDETGLDFAQARYYSSVQGRFTSPDEFTGGPDELFDFVDDAADNPTFYADLTNPQSLNKYQYTYNNPLNMVDPDGHCPDCPGLIIVTPETRRTIIDVFKGVGNAIVNIGKDINNTNAEFGVAGATHDGSYREAENMAQAVGQVVTDRVLTLGGLLGGRAPAGIVSAKASTTAIVAAESGALRATKQAGAVTQPNAAPTGTIVSKRGVTIYRNTNDHAPAHLHVEGGRGSMTRIGQNGNPLVNNPALSRTQRQVVVEHLPTIRKAIQQIMKEHRFNQQ